MFSTKSLFKKCVQVIALRDNFQYVTVKSNKEVMILQCAIGNCKWSLCASCSIHEDRQATFTVIKDLIKNKSSLASSELSTPKDIVHFIRAEHGLSISYQKAWHARGAASDDIRGSPENSYEMLPRFAYILELNNPSCVIEYKVDVDGRFLYFFMALSASIFCWQHCRPVISIDGISLKNKYGGTLLSASTPDANDQIFPLAFCVVDS
ncbi:protein FAR-RED ELONGATED HYPOCOTYL 3-like [Cucumis melo var. makuwa]|uniref:Protein FAR-RED ELONGATED HYPOCOTYL 3-like n=1 Tax=Cucumis melo var. makuwa TaxID=1194695 RepID=A0A5D3BVK7_CUCMM|nr:protein FAR-RED ELONGATED HYPOCOTYL 3-like [Cucumis melo var. makuwa]